MTKPRFSIIVPVYNGEKHLVECVESLINQTYSNIEIILIDDGSRDTSPKICDMYRDKDNRIKVIHKVNGGVSVARSVGVASSNGEYIMCVDADDKVSLNYAEKFSAIIDRYDPDVVCCGCWMLMNNVLRKKPFDYIKGYYSQQDLIDTIFPMLIESANAEHFVPNLWGKVFRRELYVKQQYDGVNITVGEDGACTIACLALAKSMYIMDEWMYYYRINPDSITNSHKVFEWDGPKLISMHLEKKIDMRLFDFREQLYRKTIHDLYCVILSQFNRDENYFTVVKEIKIVIKDPYYQNAIRNAQFTGSMRALMMLLCMKHSCFFPLKLYSVKHNRETERFLNRIKKMQTVDNSSNNQIYLNREYRIEK